MSATQSFFIRNLWYYAMPGAVLAVGQMKSKKLLGEPVLFARRDDSSIFAMRDICPHRAMPLSYGSFDGKEVECCYHGWRFDGSGACTCVPSLTGAEGIEPSNIKVRSYPVQESQGGIWIFIGNGKSPTTLPPVPRVADIPENMTPSICEILQFPCYIDHAVIGLMDPAHGPFVHTSWWWRTRRSIHEKAKAFGPSYLGFTMKRHKPSKNSFAYKLLGGAPETEIGFQLPGVRVENIRVGRHVVGGLTCVTPIDDTHTEITHTIYTTIGWLRLFAPLARLFVRGFLEQDKNVVVRQQDGLKHESNLMLIRDADTQARWYHQLKNEFERAQQENRTFENPVKDTVLKWRS
jgi:hypothetical protein